MSTFGPYLWSGALLTKKQICGWRHHPTRVTNNMGPLVHVECPCGTISYGRSWALRSDVDEKPAYRRVVRLFGEHDRTLESWVPRRG